MLPWQWYPPFNPVSHQQICRKWNYENENNDELEKPCDLMGRNRALVCFMNIHSLAMLGVFLFSKEGQPGCWWVFREWDLVICIMISSGTQWGSVAIVLRSRTWWEVGGTHKEASRITQFLLSLPPVNFWYDRWILVSLSSKPQLVWSSVHKWNDK